MNIFFEICGLFKNIKEIKAIGFTEIKSLKLSGTVSFKIMGYD